jgi:8-oxo-dGTP pyrophosphatase MutT (NUDIX family)
METYAGAYVFPGGRVEQSDCSEQMRRFVAGVTPADAQHLLGDGLTPELSLAHWIAAARELFEEAGICFLTNPDGSAASPAHARLLETREAVQRGEIGFAALLEAAGVCCDLAKFTYFLHRITPEHYPIRFDTRFFLAALPADQKPLHSSEEVAESLWITPERALGRSQSADFPMMPPTLAVLRLLAEHGSWRALTAAFRML